MAVRTSNLWRWATMSAATLLVLSACGDPPRRSAPATTAPTSSTVASAATTAPPRSAAPGAASSTAPASAAAATPVEDHQHTVLAGSATGDSPCEQSGAPLSEGQSVDGHGARGMAVPTPLTREQRTQLEEQQATARSVALRFPTVAEAEAAGYQPSTSYVPCIGAHYTNLAYVARFDPANPSELLYDGTAPTSKIVGLSFLIWHPGGEPEGFAGKNDHWHQHNTNGGLCLDAAGVVVGGEGTSDADCHARDGTKRELPDVWMVHDWVVPGWECTWGVFAGECPELGGTMGHDAWS